MALVQSLTFDTKMSLPSFSLKDIWNQDFSSDKISLEKGLLVVFICNHCPYAIALWSRLIQLSKDIKKKGISTVAINPNIHPDYPEDSPENMKKLIDKWNISFPYLIDSSQEVARLFQAQCTPDIYLFDNQSVLFYHGRFDDHWQDERNVSQEDLKDAVQCLLEKKPIRKKIYPSMGCSIKWLA